MNTLKYRFWEMLSGHKVYLVIGDDERYPTEDRAGATLFTERDWLTWGNDGNLHAEPIGDDELMRLAGAPMLPGMDG